MPRVIYLLTNMKKIIKIIIIFLLCVSVAGIIYLEKVPCIFLKLTNLYCPGCGATRCILSLLKGNIKEAFQYNPIFFIMIPFLILGIILISGLSYTYIYRLSNIQSASNDLNYIINNEINNVLEI